MTRHEVVARIGLLAAGTAASLLIAEGLCRLLGLPRRTPTWARIANTRGTKVKAGTTALVLYPSNPRGYFKIDLRDPATRDHYLALGMRRMDLLVATRPFAIEHHYNSLVCRGGEFPARRPGVRRVLVIGDSFTEGWGVEEQDAFPQVLQRLLEAAEPGRWEVLNCGRGGADFPFLFMRLFKRGLSLEPDVVVYAMALNDALQTKAVRARHPSALDFIPRYVEPPGRFDSHLLAWLRDTRERARLSHATIEWYLSLDGKENRVAWRETLALIREMDRRMRARGGRFVLVLWPILAHLDGSYPFAPLHAEIARFARKSEIPYCDLLEALCGRDTATLRVHDVDMHPNEVCHRLAAESLVPVLHRLPP